MAVHKLEVPLDASEIQGFEPDQKVKVGVQTEKGDLISKVVRLNARGKGVATFSFRSKPAGLKIFVGPENAEDEELPGLQTIGQVLPARQWAGQATLKLPPIRITPYYWRWWRRWCRTYTVTGRVRCANGLPVPGATVCAYDVDYWWWWGSRQMLTCGTTGANGEFELKFRWCCGWWPWWWWHRRIWQLEPVLADHILPELQRDPRLKIPPLPDPRPDLRVFEKLMEEVPIGPPDPRHRLEPTRPFEPIRPIDPIRPFEPVRPLEPIRPVIPNPGDSIGPRRGAFNPEVLDELREKLVRRLPRVPQLQHLRLWPWWPWRPWQDCQPDLVFRVTQDCNDTETVIVDEGPFETRWNVPTHIDVDLTANGNACCAATPDPDPPGTCIVISSVCRWVHDQIGGNEEPVSTTPAQAGYLNPGLASTAGDRPFAGVVSIRGAFGTLSAVDYYELEWRPESGGAWSPMPGGSIGGFSRRFYGPPVAAPPGTPSDFNWVSFPLQLINGRRVISSRQFYEATHNPGTWGPGNPRIWLDTNYFKLVNWYTQNHFADDTYRLRLIGWKAAEVGQANKEIVLPLCDSQTENKLIVTTDNRFVGGASGHPTAPDHPCGGGTVHTCTIEPDTDFLAVRIDGSPVTPCATFDGGGGPVEIDFLADDPDGHLSYYTMLATYGENLAVNLLSLIPAGKAFLTQLGGPPTQVGPTYPAALAQGAVSPVWRGGTYRLTIPVLTDAFPETCCYQLELRAHKRTVVNCSSTLWGHTNYSEYSFMVVVP